MSGRRIGDGFAIRERDGIRWIEADLGAGSVRFTLAFDSAGRPVDLGSAGERSARAARTRVAAALGLDPDRIHAVRQVHGGTIVTPGAGAPGSTTPFTMPRSEQAEGDGLVSRDPGESLAVQVADCLPIAIAGPNGRALLHCGWRGLGTDMPERGVELVGGTAAAIGPSIGPCCYEVGPEVAEALRVERTGAGTLDLQQLTRSRLEAAGVQRVLVAGLCTCCESDRFFSFRRQGQEAGRQMAILSAP